MLVDKTFSRKLYEYKDACYLMRTAFPSNEQIPMWLLRVLAFRKNVNFRAFYDDDQFCGVLYTAEDNKYIFVFYLAVNDRIRSKGYGTKILDWLNQNTEFLFIIRKEFLILNVDLLMKAKPILYSHLILSTLTRKSTKRSWADFLLEHIKNTLQDDKLEVEELEDGH